MFVYIYNTNLNKAVRRKNQRQSIIYQFETQSYINKKLKFKKAKIEFASELMKRTLKNEFIR